jgi:hypothetical protein
VIRGIQATSRINPTRPAVAGIPVRREFEYQRHSTAVLVAGLKSHEGTVPSIIGPEPL